MDSYDTRRKKANRARDRQHIREAKRQHPARPADHLKTILSNINMPENAGSLIGRILLFVRDGSWFLLHKTPAVRFGLLAVGALILFLIFGNLLAGKIFPNVWMMKTDLSGMTVEEAQSALTASWFSDMRIQLVVDGENLNAVRPVELGLNLDAVKTAENARAAGLSGIPFGHQVMPVIEFDYAKAQSALLDMTTLVDTVPYEAGYEWRDNQIVGVAGKPGRRLDVLLTLQRLAQDPAGIAAGLRLDLLTTSDQPSIVDPSPYLDEAYALLANPFIMTGYDPFRNEFLPWTTTPDEIARWLAAGENGLTLRQEAFDQFIGAINTTLNSGSRPRYVDEREAGEKVAQALASGKNNVDLRVRYLPHTYEVTVGDNCFRIGRKMGLPCRLIDEANTGINWNLLSVGQVIQLPSRDQLLPEDPMPEKRIVVDLDRKWLVAYENGQMVFHWQISSGRPDAPTYPGIFQILLREDVAYGSGFTLCGETGCNQWEMSWFMGIYEVTPGLMNGFHGAVLLPTGGYLDGGQTGHESTFGCVMSQNDNARLLYDWAEMGTVVEIISSEFAPESDLGREAQEFINSVA